METLALVIFFIGWPAVMDFDDMVQMTCFGDDDRIKKAPFVALTWIIGTFLLLLNIINKL